MPSENDLIGEIFSGKIKKFFYLFGRKQEMRKLTKFLALALAAMMVLSFAGCGEPATQSDADFKVGVIHIGDPADGSGYSYAHDLGIQDMQKNLNLYLQHIIS